MNIESVSKMHANESLKSFIFRVVFVFVCVLAVVMNTSCSKPGDATVQKAMQAYSQKDYDAALELFKQASGEETHYSPELIDTFISTVYSQQQDLPNAILYQEKALAIRHDYRGYVTLGMMYHMTGDDAKAEQSYRSAIAFDEKQGEAYASLAVIFIAQNRPEEALLLLQKAAELEPKLAVVHANLAVVYAMLGRNKESDSSLAKASELKCENLSKFKQRIEDIRSNSEQKK
jgi:tetratricopeptide (TPR) repeat protein